MNTKYEEHRSELLEDPDYALETAKGEFIMDVTERICEIMEEEEITRNELARRLDKTKGYVSQLLNHSRNMTLGTLAHIVHVLGYKPELNLVKSGESGLSFDREFDFASQWRKYEKIHIRMPE